MNVRAEVKKSYEGTYSGAIAQAEDNSRASAMDAIVILNNELNMLAEQWELFEERTSAIYLVPESVPLPNDEQDIAYDPTSRLLQEIRALSDKVRDIRYRIEDAKERVQL